MCVECIGSYTCVLSVLYHIYVSSVHWIIYIYVLSVLYHIYVCSVHWIIYMYVECIISYITNLVWYTYCHWFFNPECVLIYLYIFQSPKKIKICDDKTLRFTESMV